MSSLRFDAPFASDAPLLEPGPDQRWTTWPASSPTQRGPLPYPDWVVTEAGAFDTELGIVKTGKEADLFLIERAVPGTTGTLLAAKRYRNTHHSDFHRSGSYEEGRVMRNTRDARAVGRKSAHGRSVAAGHWAASEFAALSLAWRSGVPVPYPVQVSDTEVLMEFIGDGRVAAPRLAQSRLRGGELADAYHQVVEILTAFARAGFAHGDLSPYNLLEHHGRIVVIDLPQIVDVAANPQGMDFMYRDVVNVSTWFTRRAFDNDPEELFADLVATMW